MGRRQENKWLDGIIGVVVGDALGVPYEFRSRDESEADPDTKVRMVFEPRGAQIEALCALENARAEGAVKGLVQAATGVGKTYLAAFDSQQYRTVLFVAHREEILKQAAESFRNVRKSDEYGFFAMPDLL